MVNVCYTLLMLIFKLHFLVFYVPKNLFILLVEQAKGCYILWMLIFKQQCLVFMSKEIVRSIFGDKGLLHSEDVCIQTRLLVFNVMKKLFVFKLYFLYLMSWRNGSPIIQRGKGFINLIDVGTRTTLSCLPPFQFIKS